jgi:long-chain fatty acid transport protein
LGANSKVFIIHRYTRGFGTFVRIKIENAFMPFGPVHALNFFRGDFGSGFKAGASYKTTQSFGDFELENTYLNGMTSTNDFNMDYPAIYSVGLGYSKGDFDLALDYRLVDYENTDGFSTTGWTPTASVAGFGWKNMNIVSAGVQYKGVENLPIRVGYTYSSNPIEGDVAFFNIPATAIIENAF